MPAEHDPLRCYTAALSTALVCAVATALFWGGRAEQEQEIAMVEHGEDAAVA